MAIQIELKVSIPVFTFLNKTEDIVIFWMWLWDDTSLIWSPPASIFIFLLLLNNILLTRNCEDVNNVFFF